MDLLLRFLAQEEHRFVSTYRCYAVSMSPGQSRPELERGGKILLPPSALDMLTRHNVDYPMLFRLTNVRLERFTHCGVLEFVADEGKMYIPYWMMQNLMIDEGDQIRIENVTLPVATFSKFEPQSSNFLDISNPKAMLENALRNFGCLTTGEIIAIHYNNRVYQLRVVETRPADAVNIIECDMDVDFEQPIDYVEPGKSSASKKELDEFYTDAPTFTPFSGSGKRVDGKTLSSTDVVSVQNHSSRQPRGEVPDYDFRIGQLNFCRNTNFNSVATKGKKAFIAFGGVGATLKSS